ncbi:MAG: efflux RND transporter periplasmic adaptor subunit [Labilithrix sp.]|nr:efflux RND transporter periplasmic adaptor subunit [Labilithrix sp.]MCW5816250.1 efflux RND transporter periplasmic adaptor subunit [Labilithrix sp.]
MQRRSILALVALVACSAAKGPDKEAPPPKRKAPETTPVVTKRLPKTLAYAGTIVAPRDATVSSSRGGRVDAYAYEVGQKVKSGDVLVKLGAAELAFASQAAAASASQAAARIAGARDPGAMPAVVAAKAELDSANDAAQRAEKLFAQGSMSEREMARTKTNVAAAQASYDRAVADARADLLRVNELNAMAGQASAALGDKAIRAPFDGVVFERFVEIGQMAAPNAPLLRVVDPSELRIRFDVSQFDADKVALGRNVTVAFGGKTIRGQVVRSTPGLVGAGSSRLVEAKLSEVPDPAPLPGAVLPAALETGEEEDLVEVPRSATTSTAGLSRAWVIEDGKLTERLLAVARFEGDRVFVRRGLKNGDKLVKAPQPDFKLGEEVTP